VECLSFDYALSVGLLSNQNLPISRPHTLGCRPKAKVEWEEEDKTGTARVPGVLNSTKENLQVYVVGDPSSRIEVVIFRGL